MYRNFLKRILDIALSFCGLVVLLVPFFIIALIIKLESQGPVFFLQKRMGKNKVPFTIYKFRSMSTSAPSNVATVDLVDSKDYITRFGSFMRKTSIDELPQILNILKGDMSIIGPRPVICNETDLINERDKYGANDILPGLTGLAQINGRDELNYQDKARLDGEYAKNICFSMDYYCFVNTIWKVAKQEGIVEGCSANTKEE